MTTTFSNNALFESTANTDADTAALLKRIHEIGPLLRENAPIADEQRRMPDASIEAIESTGAFGIYTLKEHGGLEGGVRMLFEAARTLGYYCSSAGWVTVISNGSVLLQNRYPAEVRARVHADGKPVKMASIFITPRGSAVRDGDGYRLSGEWPFGSNIHHADWAIGLAPVMETADADPQPGFALVKRGDYTIKDTWFTVGMRGTGSNTMVVDDLWIPADQLVMADKIMGPGFEADPDAAFVQRLAPLPAMATTLAASAAGAAQAALDYVAEKSHTRGITYSTYPTQTSSPAFVEGLGRAAMKIESSLLHLRRSADVVDQYGRRGEPMPEVIRARARGDIGHCGFQLAEAVNDLMWLHGTAAFAEFGPLSRWWRDVNTATRHQVLSAPFNYEVYGEGLLGLPFETTLL